jgi:hypothetical protein
MRIVMSPTSSSESRKVVREERARTAIDAQVEMFELAAPPRY